MPYTVKKVAGMSGVSVRTLHFYDENGLLKPAYQAANGYRFYEEEQLLSLQQILFYRELGFPLKQIKKLLSRNDFDKLEALRSHRKVLQGELARIRKLVETIDKTIEHLKGKKKMKSEEMFAGFDPEQQAKYEQYLVDRYGEGMKQSIDLSKKKVKAWSNADWLQFGSDLEAICKDLVTLMGQQLTVDSREVQEVIRRHHQWLKRFWTPTAKSYAGHSELIVDSELRKADEARHPELPEFIAAAIKVFAKAGLA